MFGKLIKYFSLEARIKRASDAGLLAAKVVANNFCSDEDMRRYWSDACSCEAFGSKPRQAYDKSFKEALRPIMKSRRLL